MRAALFHVALPPRNLLARHNDEYVFAPDHVRAACHRAMLAPILMFYAMPLQASLLLT